MNRKTLPTQARLQELFTYNADTGLLVRRMSTARKSAGQIIKPVSPTGYVHIRVDGISYPAHRLIWKYATDQEPEIVDHIDGRKSNNRLVNLRAATARENAWNRTQVSSRADSGHVGVYRVYGKTLWRACVETPQGPIFVGPFRTTDQAAKARNHLMLLYRGDFHRKA